MDTLFGHHAVNALLQANNMLDPTLYIEQSKISLYKDLMQSAKNLKWKIETHKNLNSLFPGKRHQGVAATFKFQWGKLDDVIDKPKLRLLMLDRIQDPHNFGACIRSATAFGVSAIIIPQRDQAPLSETVHKTACGGTMITPIIRATNLNQAITELKDRGVWFIATDELAEQTIHNIDLNRPLCLVMGSEGHGVKHRIKASCDFNVKIETSPKLPTLNVSVATGILLSQLFYDAVL